MTKQQVILRLWSMSRPHFSTGGFRCFSNKAMNTVAEAKIVPILNNPFDVCQPLK